MEGYKESQCSHSVTTPIGGRVLQRREVNSIVAEFRIPNNAPNSICSYEAYFTSPPNKDLKQDSILEIGIG